MQRLGNPLDGRQALPTHLVAQGGADCTSTTCSSSCVVTAIVSSIMSARLVGQVQRAPPAAPEPPDPTDAGATPPRPAPSPAGTGTRVLAGLTPLFTAAAAVMGFLSEWAIAPVLVYAGLLWAIARRLPDSGLFVQRHLLLMAGMTAFGAVEFAAYLYLIFK